jgi:hypothetical protein
MQALRYDCDDVVLECRLQPRASRDEIVGVLDGHIKIRITSPPVDGQANAHLVKFLAAAFGVTQRQVDIEHGEKGRSKRIRIRNPVRLPAPLTDPGRP